MTYVSIALLAIVGWIGGRWMTARTEVIALRSQVASLKRRLASRDGR